jgi:hypothetical protein
MVMSLNHLVELLIDESKSQYMRAIRLFEFQTAVYHPKAFKRLVATQGDVRAPTRMLKTARIFAAIKILEKIEADLKQKKGDGAISIKDLAADEDYRSIFDDVIATNGGWMRIRHSKSVRSFDKGNHANKGALAAAKIVDFSYRFSKHLAGTRYPRRSNPGGVEASKYVVRNVCEPPISKSTIKTRWREYQSSAIFLYLLLKQGGFDLRPDRVGSKHFLDVLLSQVDDVDMLRKYFSAYQVVHSALSKLKYKRFAALDLDLRHSPPPQLDAPEFCPKIKTAFDKWLRDGDPD